jgi:hypothetical protein
MDKNFISVDDLMRQRLGGGEERERSGAWLNMRDLLDKEMPQQRRIGIFYWRRLFGVVAVLSLVGTLSVGSYQLSSAYNSNKLVADAIGRDFSAANHEPAGVYSQGMNETGGAEKAKLAVRTSGHIDGITKNKQRHIVIENKVENTGITAGAEGSNGINEVAIVEGSATTTLKSQLAAAAIADRSGRASGTLNKRSVKNSNVSGQADEVFSAELNNEINKGNSKGNNLAHATGNAGTARAVGHNIAPARHAAANGVASGGNGVGEDNDLSATQTPVAETEIADVKGDHKTENKTESGNNNNVATTSQEAVADDEDAASDKGNAPEGKNNDLAVLNGSATVKSNTHVAEAKKEQTGLNIAATGNGTQTNTGAIAGKTSSTTTKEVAAKHSSSVKSVGAVAAKGNSNNNASSSKSTHGAVLTTGGVAMNEIPKDAEKASEETATAQISAPNPDNNTQGKRVITKLVVHERNIKVAENEYALRVDTISMEKVNMDLGITPAPLAKNDGATADNVAADNKTAVEVTGKRKKGRGRRQSAENAGMAVSAGTSASANGSTPGATVSASRGNKKSSNLVASSGKTPSGNTMSGTSIAASGTEEGLSGAEKASNVAGKSGIAESSTAETVSIAELNASGSEVKAKVATEKKHSGVSLIQKLSLAFNEVKQNASATRFVAGLTAGINSNFFGPSTFKGFQFGLTGDIIFNSNWNIMTEMKYFHRLNNNTSIDDNFYSYTPVGGQYRKQLQLNSYSFSALHSLEMPVAVRYSKGSFNFYAGANFLYSFSINTGATTLPASTVAPEYVAEPGNDDKGVLSETDFKSRFGLGYLFGFSYKVAPNVDIDLRNVQTVWDNAATTGAKSISGQLYKTPSLQLSIMYRLGGHRSRD